ncbi:MAG: ABC transporter permease [Chloroflexi bacterium]|nr:ABC transporter permease [Chloroflexota bacterium]
MKLTLRFPSGLYFWLMIVFQYLPVALLVVFSFNDSATLTFPLQGFTLDWYVEMARTAPLLESVRNSLMLAVVSSLLATVLGAMGAIAVTRFDFRGKRLLIGLTALPLIIPYIVIGVALLMVLRALDLDLSLWTALLAHVVVSLPVTTLVISTRVMGFPESIINAAYDLGAGFWTMLRRVLLPMSAPALVSAALIAFTISFNEFFVTNFLIGSDPTLPIYIFSQLRNTARLPVTITVTALIMVTSVALLLIAAALSQFGRKS